MSYTTACQQDQPTFEEATGRVEIIQLPRSRETIYVSSDATKFYARTHFGMVGEGVVEVGWSSVNGAISEGFNTACVDYVREHIRTRVADDPNMTKCSDAQTAMMMLWGLVYEADRAYNTWLGQHQGEY